LNDQELLILGMRTRIGQLEERLTLEDRRYDALMKIAARLHFKQCNKPELGEHQGCRHEGDSIGVLSVRVSEEMTKPREELV
jgi:hypothetical protein